VFLQHREFGFREQLARIYGESEHTTESRQLAVDRGVRGAVVLSVCCVGSEIRCRQIRETLPIQTTASSAS
jgi:hypothetical protein